MTLKELNNLRYIDGEIRMIEERIAELYTHAERATPNVTTYIHTDPKTGKKETCVLPLSGGAGTGHSRIESTVEAIEKEKQLLESIRAKRQQEKQKLLEFIQTIPDSQTRQIFTYRFVDLLSWNKIAARMGGGNTWKNLSNICYRYIDENLKDNI